MPRERVYRTRAIILKRREQGEADRVITVFTPEKGKRALLAKGVRKSASRKAGHLEPFTQVSLLLAKGRTWDIIIQAETVYAFRGLREDLDRAAYAYYFAELVDAFTREEDAHPEIYDLLLSGFHRLEESANMALTARWFELAMLKLSGYQPQFFHCVECAVELQPQTNYFSAEMGGMLCPRHGEGRRGVQPVDVNVQKVLRYIQTRPYAQVMQLKLSQGRLNQVERLLGAYIRFILERRLKSPVFIHRLSRL